MSQTKSREIEVTMGMLRGGKLASALLGTGHISPAAKAVIIIPDVPLPTHHNKTAGQIETRTRTNAEAVKESKAPKKDK